MRALKKYAEEIYKSANLIKEPSYEKLREMARHGETTTEFGSPSYITKIRARSAKFTDIIYDEPNQEQREVLEKVVRWAKGKELVMIERTMCDHEPDRLKCRYIADAKYARIPLMWGHTLFPVIPGEPDLWTFQFPDWPQRKMLVDAEAGVTFLLGSDYMGEVKKSFLRMTMYAGKRRGGQGLHAGSKLLRIKGKSGKLAEKGVIFFGLSGTGKTTLSCHDHWLKKPEGVVIRQDDVVTLKPDGRCVGTENNFYIKTEGLTRDVQPGLYNATTSRNAFLENIHVEKGGKVDFLEYGLTSNGRAVVLRKEIADTDNEIDLPHLDIAIFITRRFDIVPAVARLTHEQGAAFFMLGESVQTSAGDPAEAGKPLKVVGTNPFIVGPEYEEGNIFYDILKKNPKVECYLMNTGWVGGKDKGEKIKIRDSSTIIREIARGTIKWKKDSDWGYEVGEEVPGIDIKRLDPRKFYPEDEYRKLTEVLKKDRTAWLARFPQLYPQIPASIGGG